MADIRLVRGAFLRDRTFGMLSLIDGHAFAVTVERERDNNRPSTKERAGACIPAGSYICRRVQSPTFGDTFEVTGVPGRLHILFHSGNLATDSRGCIIVGHGFDPIGAEDGVVQSKKEFAEFLKLQQGCDSFRLTIIDAY